MPHSADPPISDLMTEFLEYQQSRNLSPYTLRNYRMTFASFRRFLAETEVPDRASAA